MRNLTMKKTRFAAIAVAASLVTMSVVAIAPAAHASSSCDAQQSGSLIIEVCTGTTSDGAKYEYRTNTENFNGTVYLWSHGYRYNFNLPPGIEPAGGTTPYLVDKSPEIGPAPAVIQSLLEAGFAVAGSGFSSQGWNAAEAVKTNVELIDVLKSDLPDTKGVIAWGASLGGFITQALAERYPKLIKSAAPICTAAGNVNAELVYAQDLLWGLKTFFDPSITVSGYAAGPAGVGQAAMNLGKVAAVLTHISSTLTATDNTKTWPATSTMPATIKAIPARSALTLVGLMAGVPTQSQHIDGSSFPGTETGFALALAPAIAIAQNTVFAAGLGIMATVDLETRVGGTFYDNRKTDYAKRIADERASFNVALSGNAALDGMLSILSSPLAPRITASDKGAAGMKSLLAHKGKATVPTITMTGTADMITPAGNSQWLADKNAKNSKKFLPLWVETADKWTKFTATGLPDTSSPAWANGTGHCKFSGDQIMTVAKLAAAAAKTGSVPSNASVAKTVAKVDGLLFDRAYSVPLLKYYQK
jgi:pimeloyl-ACP methyl ester carboxylesterase